MCGTDHNLGTNIVPNQVQSSIVSQKNHRIANHYLGTYLSNNKHAVQSIKISTNHVAY